MTVLPTVDALCSSDEVRLERELRLAAVLAQTAVVRGLVAEFEGGDGAPLRERLAVEVGRLGISMLAASATAAAIPVERASSVVLVARTTSR